MRLAYGEAEVEGHAFESARLVRQAPDRHQQAEQVGALPPLQRDADLGR